jgi:hypothetical protein
MYSSNSRILLQNIEYTESIGTVHCHNKCTPRISDYCISANVNALEEYALHVYILQVAVILLYILYTISHLLYLVAGGSVGVVTFGGNGSLAALTLHSPGDSASFVPLSHDGDAIRSHRPPPRIDAEVAAVWMGFGEAYGGLWYTAKQGMIHHVYALLIDACTRGACVSLFPLF